jgi:DNA modification methylase
MFLILIFNKALKLHLKKNQPWTTNKKNSSNAFSYNQGTYIKHPKFKIESNCEEKLQLYTSKLSYI